MIAVTGALLFGFVAILTLLATFGLPLGEFTMGGKYRVLPPNMRVMAGVSFFIQVFAILLILQAGVVIPLWFPASFVKGACFFFAVYLTLNTAMNFLSNSKKEKVVMTPLSSVTAVCFLITALTM